MKSRSTNGVFAEGYAQTILLHVGSMMRGAM